MGKFLGKLMGTPQMSSRCSATSTSQWIEPCCWPGPPTIPSSGSTGVTTNHHRPVEAAALAVLPQKGRKDQREMSEGCCSPTRPIVPAATRKPGYSGNRTALGPTSAIWATASWRTRRTARCAFRRNGLVVASEVTPADGYGERAEAVRMARSLQGAHQKTLGAVKG